MRFWPRTFAVLMLMLVLPLQALAAVLAPLHCEAENTAPVAISSVSAHDAAHHDHGPANAPADHENSEHAGHLCCHHAFTGATTAIIAAASPQSSIYESADPGLPPPHFPERQQRPPRT